MLIHRGVINKWVRFFRDVDWNAAGDVHMPQWYGNTLFSLLRLSKANIYVGTLTIIGSDNGLSPNRRQDIIRTNAGILLIGPHETNFS